MRDDIKILVIDDEPDLGEIIVSALIESFPKTEYVGSPVVAKDLVEKENFDLILSDIKMPQLPGPELVRFLRANGKLTPVIFVTGHASRENLLTSIRLGVSDVVEKPFDPDGLLASVHRVVEIDRRKTQFILDNADPLIPSANIEKQKKMLGLLHVLIDKKSA